MHIKYQFYFCILLLAIVCVAGSKKEKEKDKPSKNEKDKPTKNEKDKPDEAEEVPVIQQTTPQTRPQYINQFSQSLKFLSSFFQVLHRQLNTTIETFNPQKPNPILSTLLANPNLIPFALRRLRDPLVEMIRITNRLETILSNDTNIERNSQEVIRLLTQLQRRLQTTFGILMPREEELTTRMPTSLPEAIESVRQFINQFAQMFATFSQTIRNYATNGTAPAVQTKPLPVPIETENNNDFSSQINDICSRLQTLEFLASVTNSSDPLLRQGFGGIGSIFQGLLRGIVNFLGSMLGLTQEETLSVLINLFAGLNPTTPHTKPTLGDNALNADLFANLTLGDNSIEAVLPLTSRQQKDFHQTTFGVINTKNRLVVTNIISKDIDRNSTSVADKKQFQNQLPLSALHSMMDSLVSQMEANSDAKYIRVLKCQLNALGCSLQYSQQSPEVDKCLQTLSSCIGTGL